MKNLSGGSSPSLRIYRSRLATLDEVVEHYPYKTPDLDVVELRRTYLPVLAAYLSDYPPRFGDVATEYSAFQTFISQDTPSGTHQQRKTHVEATWKALDAQLLREISNAPPSIVNALIIVIAKGREYCARPFEVFKVRRTLRQAVADVARLAHGNAALLETVLRLKDFVSECLPRDELARATLKDSIYHLVDFSGSSSSRLSTEVKHFLLTYDSNGIAPWLGIKDVASVLRHYDSQRSIIPAELSSRSKLDRLLERDVLRKFDFVGQGGATVPTLV